MLTNTIAYLPVLVVADLDDTDVRRDNLCGHKHGNEKEQEKKERRKEKKTISAALLDLRSTSSIYLN